MKTCVLVLDNIRSVENTGSIFRTAEGLGVVKIYICGTTPAPTDRFGRKRDDFSKVALGAEEMMGWEYRETADELIEELRGQNFKIYALEQAEDSEYLHEFQSDDQFALIVGNEVEGVSESVLQKCDDVLEIEMKGKKESLNVSVATGIALFELLGRY